MKRILLLLTLIITLSSAAKAQLYVGGTGLIGYTQDAFKFGAKPSIGYKISNRFAIGFEGGFVILSSEVGGIINPYLRYTFWKNDRISIDGKLKSEMMLHDSELCDAELGFAPSIRIKLNQKWELSADLGIIGAQMDYDMDWKPAFGVTASGIEVAFLYNF